MTTSFSLSPIPTTAYTAGASFASSVAAAAGTSASLSVPWGPNEYINPAQVPPNGSSTIPTVSWPAPDGYQLCDSSWWNVTRLCCSKIANATITTLNEIYASSSNNVTIDARHDGMSVCIVPDDGGNKTFMDCIFDEMPAGSPTIFGTCQGSQAKRSWGVSIAVVSAAAMAVLATL